MYSSTVSLSTMGSGYSQVMLRLRQAMQCGRCPSHLCFRLRQGVQALPEGSLGFTKAGPSMASQVLSSDEQSGTCVGADTANQKGVDVV